MGRLCVYLLWSMNCPIRVACLLLLSVPPLSAATYEVAERNPRASDANDGSLERPWKTIARAADQVKPGDTVIIRDGIYRERIAAKVSGCERIAAKVSGTAESPITFAAAAGAHGVLTGADRLTGWKKVKDGTPIYQVDRK